MLLLGTFPAAVSLEDRRRKLFPPREWRNASGTGVLCYQNLSRLYQDQLRLQKTTSAANTESIFRYLFSDVNKSFRTLLSAQKKKELITRQVKRVKYIWLYGPVYNVLS